MGKETYKTIDEYFATCDLELVEIMRKIREIIKENAPDAIEKISWGMPTFYFKENLVHFFAHKNHIGFYPGEKGIEEFKEEFDALGYKYSKGAVQFPLKKEMPYDLIARITKYRVDNVMK